MVMLPEVTVDDTLRKLAVFNELTTFGISAEDIERLRATAPVWPTKPGCMRSLRLRIIDPKATTYDYAVTTYNAHVKMLHATLGEHFYQTNQLAKSHIDYFPVYGMHVRRTTACEWVIIDLMANDGKKLEELGYTVEEMQSRFCADELLAAAWINPGAFITLLDAVPIKPYRDSIHWRLGGYESSIDVPWGPAWGSVSLEARHSHVCTIDDEISKRLAAFDGLRLTDFPPSDCSTPEIVP